MKSPIKLVAGILILLAGVAFAVLLFLTKPEAEKKADEKLAPLVQVVAVRPETLRMSLPSQGLVEPRMKTALATEVAGKVVSVSPKFKAGGEFEKGETLIAIDPSDYRSAVAQSKAGVADAKLALETELAKAEQARRDWKRLGRGGEPGDLTLRKPHVESARAKVEAAEAALAKADRDLERTEIQAPFAGRLEAIHTEEGAYLLPGTRVAEIYTTSPYEIRLPLSLDDWMLLGRDEAGDPGGEVAMKVKAGGDEHEWTGKIVRTEGLVERESRSIYVVAQFGGDEAGSLIQPGLFVRAQVAGKTLDGVYRLPVRSFRGLDEVVVVDDENQLRFKKVKVLRRSVDEVLVTSGVEDGDRLSVTELSDIIQGMEVRVEETGGAEEKLTGEPTPKP